MVQVEGEIVINRPVEEVFDFVADERNEPRHNPLMRRAEKDPSATARLPSVYEAISSLHPVSRARGGRGLPGYSRRLVR